jgi:hypothetical protein
MVYKINKNIIKIFFDSNNHPQGLGYLIDYERKKIYTLTYKNGELKNKSLYLDEQDYDEVFGNSSISKLIGKKHEEAFAFCF